MKGFFIAIAVSLACTLFSFCLHVVPSLNSMINLDMAKLDLDKPLISNEYLTSAVSYHKEHPAFAKRPLTTYLLEELSNLSTLNVGESFTLINFFLLFLCGIVLYYYSICIGYTVTEATISIVAFFFSFSILFAFFPPIYSYDEPLQYLFVLLILIAVFYKNWGLYIFCSSLALVARESSLILLPGIFLLTKHPKNVSLSNLKRVVILVMPILIYILFLYFFITVNQIEKGSKQDFVNRLSHFYGNFRNVKFTIESISSFLLAIGFQSYLLYSYINRRLLSSVEKSHAVAFIVTLVINTLVVILTTQARETRLFTLPLFFLFPMLGKVIIAEYKFIRIKLSYSTASEVAKYLPLVVGLTALCITVTSLFYFQTIGSQTENLFNEYTAILSIIVITHFTIRYLLSPKSFSNKKVTDK